MEVEGRQWLSAARKYNAHPVDADGYHFDSGAEYRRYQELKLLERNGEIADLEIHPRYGIHPGSVAQKIRPIWYEADFSYIENGVLVVEDVKGKRTAVFDLKWKIVRCNFPAIDWRIVKP